MCVYEEFAFENGVITFYRLLLWDCDERTYSYYIEVSTDQRKWSRVVDKSSEACR